MMKNVILISTLIFTTLAFAAGLTPDHFERNFEGQSHSTDGITYCRLEGNLPNGSDTFNFILTHGHEKLVEIELSKEEIKEQLSLHKDFITIKNQDTSIQVNFDGFSFINFFYQKSNDDRKITTQFTCGKD
jgi:hypothetical protein